MIALAYAGWPSKLITRGDGAPPDNARRRNSFATVRSRLGDNMNSNRFAGRINGAIQVGPFACYFNVGLVDPPGPIGMAHLAANSLI